MISPFCSSITKGSQLKPTERDEIILSIKDSGDPLGTERETLVFILTPYTENSNYIGKLSNMCIIMVVGYQSTHCLQAVGVPALQKTARYQQCVRSH